MINMAMVRAKISTMRTLRTLAAARAAFADSGSARYHQSPPSTIRTAPQRAGLAERDSIRF